MAATHEDRNAQLSPGVAIKAPCRAATTGAITLSTEQAIDGVACVAGDRVLVKDQTDQTTNGIYLVSTGSWTREPDFDGNRDVVKGTFVFITNGATNAGAFYECTTANPITFGSSLITFAQGALGPIAIPISATNVTFTPAGANAVARSVQEDMRERVSVTQFMSPAQKADVAASTFTLDVTAAIVSVIASVPSGSEIVWPPGGYLCAGQVVPSTTYPNGIRHRALASSGERNGTGGGPVLLKYTGTAICWDIQNALGTAETGGWEWEGMNFEATQGAGGMFNFNNTAIPPTGDSTSQNYILQVSFKSCHLKGANAGASQTGNAIQGTKLFHLHIDEHCVIERWKRGTWLFGCDNATLAARYISNTRHVQMDRSGAFGNDNFITSRYIGVMAGSAETRYMAYLNCDCTMLAPCFETATASDTCIYIGSYNVSIYDPVFSMAAGAMVELGAGARDAHIWNPSFTGVGAVVWNTIAAPLSWDFGGVANYSLNVHEPNDGFLGVLTQHPRIRIVKINHGKAAFPRASENAIPYATGEMRLGRRTCTAFNYWGLTAGSDMGTVPSIVADASAPFGYAIQLPSTNLAGFYCNFGVIGKGIENGDVVNVRVYYAMSGVPAAGSFRVQVGKNSTGVSNTALTVSAVYVVQNFVYTLSGFVAGDVVSFSVFNSAVTDRTLNVADISMTIVQAAVVDTSGATLPNVEIEVNKLKAAMRIAGIISF